jgi:very-short-patch-repair endonuclease
VEYDGEQHRTDDRQYEKDLRRLEHLRELGWTVVVVRRSGLYSRPAETVHRIAAALRSAAG